MSGGKAMVAGPDLARLPGWSMVTGGSMKRLCLLALLLSQPAWAEWTAFFETKGSAFYMDSATIRKTESGRRVWALVDYKEVQKGPDPYYSIKYLKEYDCAGEKTRVLQLYRHAARMGEGEVVMSDIKPTGWELPPPATASAQTMKQVCAVELK